MGVMQRLRENTHFILWGILILFIVSMTVGGLVGGANVLDIFTKNPKRTNVAGKINNTKIEIRQFSDAIQYQAQTLRQQGREVDSRTMDMLSDRVWNSFVNELLINEQVEKYNFQASDGEIFENLEKNPPAFLQQQPAFLTDGKFDYQKYYSALSNPQGNEWLGVEMQMRAQLPMNKVVNYVQAMTSVSEEEIKNEYLKNNVKYSLESVTIPIAIVKAEDMEVSDTEIAKRYNDNKEDYLQKETRNLKYVSFEIKPAKNDSTSIKILAEDLIKRINNGENFETVAAEYTEDPSGQNNGGDLGWFPEGRMVKPFTDACFNTKKGEISEPVLTQFGYHIIKVEDFRTTNDKKEIKARHILLKIKVGPETSNTINSNANLFAYDANDLGFEVAADSFNVEVKNADKISQDTRYLPELGSLPSAARFAFSNKPIGEVSKLYQTEKAFVIFKLDKINEEHYKALEDVQESIKNTLVKEKREKKLKEIADEIYATVKTGNNIAEIRDLDKSYAFSKVDTVALTGSIGNLGRSNKVVGTVLALNINEISTPVELSNKCAFIKLLSKTEFKQEDFDKEKETIRKKLVDQKKQFFYSQWMQALRDDADIFDNRANIF